MKFHMICAGALSVWCVAAAATPAEYPAQVYGELGTMMATHIAPRFTVFPDDELDEETRAAALTMAAAHLPRVQALLARWLEEEWKADPSRALTRVYARLANEFALWGRDRIDADDDSRLALALRDAGMCRLPGRQPSELVMRLARYAALPPASRHAAARSEAALLARWGSERVVDTTEALPLDPLMATPPERCAVHQAAAATPEQFRAAMAMPVADLAWLARDVATRPAAPDQLYPRLAQHYGVQGTVTIEAEVDELGQAQSFRVTKRELSVPGLGQTYPAAFLGLLDPATLALARAKDWSAAKAASGTTRVSLSFVWTLD